MMKKITIFAILVLVALLVVACKPELSKEETLAGLDDLSEEELNAVMNDDDVAVAGKVTELNIDPKARTLKVTGKLKKLKVAKKYYFTWKSCTDSDEGMEPKVRGTLKEAYDSNGKKGTIVYEDTCTGKTPNMLKEYFCVKNKFYYKYVECPGVCVDGACGFESKQAEQATFCGNGVLETDEKCDGLDLAGTTCTDLNVTWTGTLSCTNSCEFNTTQCS